MKKYFMLLLLTFVSANSHAEPLCADDLNSGKVIVDQSIKDFCVEARKEKVATLFTYDDPASENIKNFKTDAEFNTFLNSTPEKVNAGPWIFSLYPNSKVNKIGYARKLTKRGWYGFESESEIKDFLGDLQNGASRYQTKLVSSQHKNIKDLLNDPPDQSADFKQSEALMLAV